MNLTVRLKKAVRDIKDYPKPGILFKDITPILQDPVLNNDLVEYLAEYWTNEGSVEGIAGIESRGFIWGNALAAKMGVPFIPIRKHGKLPHEVISESYDLEYGSATIEMHKDAVTKGQSILIHDDLLATGGTAIAAKNLLEKGGAHVLGYSFVIHLAFLEGHKRLDAPLHAVVSY